MQETMTRDDEERVDERALARRDDRRERAPRRPGIDLDDVPIYASTGVRKLPLGRNGRYWIEIQEELDFGQQTILDNASVIGVQREQMEASAEAGQTVRLDLTRQRFLLCAIWLTRWSLPKDEEGREIRLPRNVNDRVETLKRLSPKWGDAIVGLITEYIAEQQDREVEAQRAADEEAGIDAEAHETEPAPKRSRNGASGATRSLSTSVSSPAGAASS